MRGGLQGYRSSLGHLLDHQRSHGDVTVTTQNVGMASDDRDYDLEHPDGTLTCTRFFFFFFDSITVRLGVQNPM